MYIDIQPSVQILNIKLLKGTIVYTTCTKMAGANTKNNNYWSKVHDCTKISHEFTSEKMCFKERRVFQKNLLLKKSIKNKPLGCYDKSVLIIIAAHVAEVHNGLPVGHWGPGSRSVCGK